MRNLTLLTDLYELTMMQARLFSMPFTEKIHVTALMRFPAA